MSSLMGRVIKRRTKGMVIILSGFRCSFQRQAVMHQFVPQPAPIQELDQPEVRIEPPVTVT